MRLLAFAVLLSSTIASADSRLPAHYAALFDAAATWTYELERTTWDYDQIQHEANVRKWKKKTEKLAPITCKVERVARFGVRALAEITCDRDEGWKFPIAGTYLASPSGLRRYNNVAWPTTPEDLGADTEHELLVAAAPKARTKTTREGEQGGPRYALTLSVTRERGAWCTTQKTRGAPHDGEITLCYASGIVRGRNDVSGELDDLRYRAR